MKSKFSKYKKYKNISKEKVYLSNMLYRKLANSLDLQKGPIIRLKFLEEDCHNLILGYG